MQFTNQTISEGKNATLVNTQSINEVKNDTMVNSQAIAKMEVQLRQMANQLGEREKGKLPSQPVPNPRLQFQGGSSSNAVQGQEHVQAIVSLRSGRQVDNQVVLPEENPVTQQEQGSGSTKEKDTEPSTSTVEIPPRSFIPKAPYPNRLLAPKEEGKFKDILEVFKQILQCKLPIKHKDPGCPTISCMIGVSRIEKALLDLGASVNLLPYWVYLQLGLGELKPTSMTLQLADRSVKNVGIQIPVILGRPFLAMANTLINCRTGAMKISFGNITVELNIFDISKQPLETTEIGSACLIEEIIEDTIDETSIEDPLGACFAQFRDDLDLDKLLEQANAMLEFAPLESSKEEEVALPEPP
ncbi:uncharacterized protein LOC133866234 [Alnus glutinosa]|uniref:uncharacterized protein LOC133866234 n=1 Tax=Alnus glutinosa TaxID=3517 RepID=UPI002D76D455|nr:uncharacterized protein LOC133866234 [Alnus glutinosa]